QKNVFFEIDPFATSKDSNRRITKIDLLKPKKKATAKHRGKFYSISTPRQIGICKMIKCVINNQ
ncbi:MAG: hypothetical protein PUH81_11220, partial [Clostridiales bacterium]|nr:hypothetical protein [Clostridiales bacterium]MDY5467627.1 hypothetical protein [Eubacteriales bacterium]